jgi:hypothetical protein
MKRELKIIVPDIRKSPESLSESVSETVDPNPKERNGKMRPNNSSIESSANNTTVGDGLSSFLCLDNVLSSLYKNV